MTKQIHLAPKQALCYVREGAELYDPENDWFGIKTSKVEIGIILEESLDDFFLIKFLKDSTVFKVKRSGLFFDDTKNIQS